MSFRTFLHIPAWLLKGVAMLIVALLIGYVALTQTEVGRDGLRAELERQFNSHYEGTLHIGSLTGNLINDLYATDVRLLDPSGDIVVAVDSVVVRPGWRDVMKRRLSIRQLTLYEPTVTLTRREDDAWSLAAALRSSNPTERQSPWGFISSEIRIQNGTLSTHNEGSPHRLVRDGHLFDFTETTVEEIDLVSTVEWGPEVRLLDIRQMSAYAAGLDLELGRLHGQLVLEDDDVSITRLHARLGQSDLDVSGELRSPGALTTKAFDDVGLTLDIVSARFDFDELQRLLPSLPLRSGVDLTAQAEGTLSSLRLVSLHAEHNASSVSAAGYLSLRADTLAYTLSNLDLTLEPDDLLALYPDEAAEPMRGYGSTFVSLTGDGAVSRSSTGIVLNSARLDLLLEGDLGRIEGPIAVERRAADSLHYEGALSFANLDLERLTGRTDVASTLNGSVDFEGTGHRVDDLQGIVSADLHESVVFGRGVHSLHLDMGVADQRLDARLTLHQPYETEQPHTILRPANTTGVITSEVLLDWSSSTPHYRAQVNAMNADLGNLLQSDSLHTALNGQFSISGRGASWAQTVADVSVEADSSIVGWSDQVRVVPPYQSSAQVRSPSGEQPTISIEGDLGTFFLRGDVQQAPIATLAGLWARHLADAVRDQLDKHYHRREYILADAAPSIAIGLPWVDEKLSSPRNARTRVERALHDADLEALNLMADFHLYRLDVITSMLPMLPPLEGALQGHLEMSATNSELSIGGTLETAGLIAEGITSKSARADLDLATSLDPSVLEAARARVDLQADSLFIRDVFVDRAMLRVRLEDEEAFFALTSSIDNQQRPLQAEGSLQLRPDHNRLVLDRLELTTGSLTWTTPTRPVLELYADAVAVANFVLESRHPSTADMQQLFLSGVLSESANDVLAVRTEDVSLRAISETLLGGLSLGGIVNGRASLSNIKAPELTGSLEIEALSYDNRLLGRFEASSQYVPGQDGIALHASLSPTEEERAREFIHGTTIPARFEENRLDIEGTFKLPELDATGAVVRPSHFDLAFTADRINAFFFDYLFPDVVESVEGSFEGSGSITGSFSKPLFDASFELHDGYVEIPHFDLSYEVAGPVSVDEEGFKLGGVTVTDPTDGTASVDGAILFNDYQYFSFDLSAELDDLLFMNVRRDRNLAFYGQLWASGPATLTGPVYATTLRAQALTTSSRSELYIPVTEGGGLEDPGFIVFTDSLDQTPDWAPVARRAHILADRPVTERSFLDGMDLDLNFSAPRGSTVHLVFDPLLGDAVQAVGSGRIQLQRQEGEFFTYGTFDVSSGDYLFTAGEVFVRRFMIDQGSITWDGDPIDAQLDIQAAYRTRASRAGLSGPQASGPPIPLSVGLHITGRVSTPQVDLGLTVDQQDRTVLAAEQLQAILSQPELETEYATSVLLTNSFLLTTESGERDFFAGSAFNSVSQLVSSQLNRYLNEVLPNVDFTFGIQGDENVQDLDVTYGLALRLLDERLIIRGQGVYSGGQTRSSDDPGSAPGLEQQGLQGEFIVELRLSPRVAVEVFYRREGDLLNVNQFTNTTGAGLSYQTRFPSWRSLFRADGPKSSSEEDEQNREEPVVRAKPPEEN